MNDPSTTLSTTATASPRFLLDPILPTRSVNLIGGRSGSGKTTLLLQMLEDWYASREVFGATAYPQPFCYVACAKPREAILQTADRISCTLPLPVVSLQRDRLHAAEEPSPEAALHMARALVPSLRLLILDGIGILCRGRVTEYNVVADFMARLTRMALTENITILGVGPMAKAGSEAPKASRELFLGSVAWGEHAETMILIDKESPSDPQCDTRTVTILPTNAPPQVLKYSMDDAGRLIRQAEDNSIGDMVLEMKISALTAGAEFTTAEVHEWSREGGLSRSAAERWLRNACQSLIVERLRKGVYKKSLTQ